MNTEKAEASIVWILNEGKPCGMGCLMGWHVVTAAHCIPRAPSALAPGDDPVIVEIAPLHDPEHYIGLFVTGYEPCLDIALLGTSTLSGTDIPEEEGERFDDLGVKVEEAEVGLFPDLSALSPTTSRRVHFLNNQSRWVSGQLDPAILPDVFWLRVHLDQHGTFPGGTSGAPLFSDEGRVIGVMHVGSRTYSPGAHTATEEDAWAVYLKNALPRWFLFRFEEDAKVTAAEWMQLYDKRHRLPKI